MLRPTQLKYMKYHKGKIKGFENKSNKIFFGRFGLKALESGWIPAHQIEAFRQVIVRKVRKNNGKVWICIFPNKPLTELAKASRMGKGKGAVTKWVSSIKAGKVLVEISLLSEKTAIKILTTGAKKISLLTSISKY